LDEFKAFWVINEMAAPRDPNSFAAVACVLENTTGHGRRARYLERYGT